jgi:hypothetical protein
MVKATGVFKIKKDGTVEWSVQGIKGGCCKDYLKDVGELGTVISTEKTSEFFETAEENSCTNNESQSTKQGG